MPPTVGRVNADLSPDSGRSTATTTGRAPILLDRPLRTEPIRPSGDAGDGWGRAAAYDAYADGLHTYAIWSLRDHDAAVDALYCAFVIADRNVTQLQQPEHIHPWLYAVLRRECMLRAAAVPSASVVFSPAASSTSLSSLPAFSQASDMDGAASASYAGLGVGGPATATSTVDGSGSPAPVSGRLRPPSGAADPSGSLASLERNLRRAEFHSLEWPESEGLAPAHREILELTIRHGLDSNGLGLVLGLGQPGGRSGYSGVIGSVGSQGFGVLADAWRELERSLAAVAVAKASREHCAQLAELTVGWSGRLTATLRAPLTDHVDGCTRCQHYLHTVIGTPAAPTILPFVAAPRALREIVLDELHDPDKALRLGIDHEAIAARIQRFAPDGFPAVGEPVPVRRRGGRRAAPKRSSSRADTTTPGASGINTDSRGRRTSDVPNAPTSPAAPGPTMAMRSRPADDAGGVYRRPGSWAARVVPPDPAMEWTPTGSNARQTPRRAPGVGRDAGSDAGSLSMGTSAGAGIKAGGAASGGAHAGGAHAGGADACMAFGRGNETPTEFISTASGRFASRTSESVPFAAEPRQSGSPNTNAEAGGGVNEGSNVMSPRASRSGAHSTARAHPRHKSRPVRQAMMSAVALGTVGAAAAAAAALLGVTSDGHGSSQLLDANPPAGPIGSSGYGGGVSVSVSTPPAPATSPSALSSGVNGHGVGAGGGVSGAVGTPGTGAAGSGAAGAGRGQGVDAADFHVSVNQRAADPNSVSILLRNSGSEPIAWSATRHDPWIVLSRSSGRLGPGQSLAITATATSAAPAGQWTTSVTFAPGGAVVTLRGGYPIQSTPPASTPPTGGSGGGSTPSGPASSAPPTDGSSPTPTPPPSSSAPTGISPSTSGPSRTAPVGGQLSSSPSQDGAAGGTTSPGTGVRPR